MDVRYDLINDMKWCRGANKHIFKFKRAPKQKKPNLPIFVYYSPWIFARVGPEGQTNTFSSSNELQSGKN
ncbi:hypothetical protein H5410_039831 [Solanum commersonii]|uniref:Uncharacterized protein n=1 Tax=Solanum commersonii TaxID=4109 RepID=A0A9J5XNA2_SOLCO|nr:hypothetical protein H5410_039831 [Solanum commersonii]